MSQNHLKRGSALLWVLTISSSLLYVNCSSDRSKPRGLENNLLPSGSLAAPDLLQHDPRPLDIPKVPSQQDVTISGFLDPRPSRVPLRAGLERVTSRGLALTLLLFDDRNYRISVADKEKGPKTEWTTAQAAAKAHGALAAINGGFFTPEGSPLGLVIENGRHIGTWNAGSSLTSGVLSVEKSPRILRRRHWRSFSPTLHLVQAGPLLIENDIVVNGLGNRERSPRSFLVWNGRHHWAFGSSGKATLSELARALAAQPLAKLNITTALNLDGGRSSDLWVSPQLDGGPVSTRKSWNNPVRNYLLLHHHPQP